MKSAGTISAAGCALLLAGGCQGISSPQRVPESMPIGTADELPPPDPGLEGRFLANVVRHADPVRIRRPDAVAGFLMAFWRKTERVAAGTEVVCSAGGRAEFTWEEDATSVVFSDAGTAVLGDPSADEPLVSFRDVTHARISLTPEDVIALPGGAELRGDDRGPSGPFVLLRVADDVVRLTNQSASTGLLRYRDAALEIGPGEALDVPVVSAGTAPLSDDSVPTRLERGGIQLRVNGRVETQTGERTVGVRALGESRLEALGVSLELQPGDLATFSVLRRQSITPSEPAEGTRVDPPVSASASSPN